MKEKETQRLRDLAVQWMEAASDSVMEERKSAWKAVHDLKPVRPVVMFEPFWLAGFISSEELVCEDPDLRDIEKRMLYTIRQYRELKDDIVIEPYFRIGWTGKNLSTIAKEYGDVKINLKTVNEKDSIAFLPDHPVKTPDDISKLSHRTYSVDREGTLALKNKLEDCFGDILPVKLANFDNFTPSRGDTPFVGNFFGGISWDVFHLMGAEAMMIWPYDHPDEMHELLRFVTDDKKIFFDFVESENILESNTDNQLGGPSSYGYVSGMTGNKLCNMWAWLDSQETEMMSPEMFSEFYLPYIAELSKRFGLIYYGCCERVDHKLPYILKAIDNIRTVSCSHWTYADALAEQLSTDYVFSKKPYPPFVSVEDPNWDDVQNEATETWNAVKKNNCPLEVICRDVYSAAHTLSYAKKWVNTWKKTIGL